MLRFFRRVLKGKTHQCNLCRCHSVEQRPIAELSKNFIDGFREDCARILDDIEREQAESGYQGPFPQSALQAELYEFVHGRDANRAPETSPSDASSVE